VTLAIRDPAGLVAGMLFLTVGAGAISIASGYALGTLLHMGPGYFPVVLGVLLVLIGGGLIAQALLSTVAAPAAAPAPPSGRLALRPLLVVIASVLVFAGGIDRVGLIPSVFVTALLASLAGPKPKRLEALLIAVVLSALSAGIFFYGLKLPFALF